MDSKTEEFLRRCESLTLVRWVFPDLNGNARLKEIPGAMCHRFVRSGGRDCCSAVFSLACTSFAPQVQWILDNGFPDCAMLPDPDTFHLASWSRCPPGPDGAPRIGQAICGSAWHDGAPVEFDSRNAAKRQIERLAGHGLALYSAVELEWRLFIKNKEAGSDYTWHETRVDPYCSILAHKYEPLLLDIHSALEAAGLSVEALHTEFGCGQMEVTMAPRWGIQGPDEGFLYRDIVKQVASNHGYIVSFMAVPCSGEAGSGLHFNHSLWSIDRRANAFFDSGDQRKMSAVMRHWLAGLIHHSPAIAALTSPTLNCYRRLHLPFTPDFADWAVQSRNATFRLKLGTDSNPGGSYIENRMPSSAANAYIVAAATLAAGLDGLERQLTPPPEGSREAGRLPGSMEEALAALEADTVMQQALGPQLIEFYLAVKRQFDLDIVQAKGPSGDEAGKLVWERAQYLENL